MSQTKYPINRNGYGAERQKDGGSRSPTSVRTTYAAAYPQMNTSSSVRVTMFRCGIVSATLEVVLLFVVNKRTSPSSVNGKLKGGGEWDAYSNLEMTFASVKGESRIRYSLAEEVSGVLRRYEAFELVVDENVDRDQAETNRDVDKKLDRRWKPLSVMRWAELFSADNAEAFKFAKEITELIKEVPYKGLFFETKGCSSVNAANKQFEFVLVNAPELYKFCEANPDAGTFTEQLLDCQPEEAAACRFMNLRGDAVLVAPRPRGGLNDMRVYSHLAAFLRGAPMEEIADIWKLAAKELLFALQQASTDLLVRPVWFSTSGLGVAWLHFRLDSTPKYYQYEPFAREK